jgi:hypothetical protein
MNPTIVPRHLGVEFQGGRTFFTFRRSQFATPHADDTPRYFPQGLPSTVLIQHRGIMAGVQPRNLDIEFDETPMCDVCNDHCSDVALCSNPGTKHGICRSIAAAFVNPICPRQGCGHVVNK